MWEPVGHNQMVSVATHPSPEGDPLITYDQLRALLDETQTTIPGATYEATGGDGWQSLKILSPEDGQTCGYIHLAEGYEPVGNSYWLNRLPEAHCGTRDRHEHHEITIADGAKRRCPGSLVVTGERTWGTSGGVEVTEAMIAACVAEAEAGYDLDSLRANETGQR